MIDDDRLPCRGVATILASVLAIATGCRAASPPGPVSAPTPSASEYSDYAQQYCVERYDEDRCYRSLMWAGWSYEQQREPAKAYRAYHLAELQRPGDKGAILRGESARRAAAKAQHSRLDLAAPPTTLRMRVTVKGSREAVDRLDVMVDFEPLVARGADPLEEREIAIQPGTHDIALTLTIRRSNGRTRIAQRQHLSSKSEPVILRLSIDTLANEPRIEATTEPPGLIE